VEGYALAGGFEVALACDLVVAARGATFGLPEVTRGLVAGAGGLLRLPRRIPYHAAIRLALTGIRLSASDAFGYGLVSELCEDGAALDVALDLARTIAAQAPFAVRTTKKIVSETADAGPELFHRYRDLCRSVRSSEDAREGARAFAERRAPQWAGR
jgi:enoyl-CoA hydratase